MLSVVDGPYRAPRPLTDVIQPDRRKERAVVFGGACMVVGALLFKGIGLLLEPQPATPMMAGFGPSPPDLSTPPTTAIMAQAAYSPQPAPLPTDLGTEDVARIVATHRAMVKDRCWHPRSAAMMTSTQLTLSLVVAPNGNVVSSTGDGSDPAVANCVATQAMAWHFPVRTGGDAHLSVPFVFRAN